MKHRNILQELQHIALGAGLALLVIVTPAAARYLAQDAGGTPGGTTMTQPTQPSGTQPTQPTSGGIQPQGDTGGTQFGEKLGPPPGGQHTEQFGKPGENQEGMMQNRQGQQGRQGQQFPGQGKGVQGGFPGKGKGVQGGFPGKGFGLDSGSEEGLSEEGQGEGQQFGSRRPSQTMKRRSPFGESSLEGEESGTNMKRRSPFGESGISGEESGTGMKRRSPFGESDLGGEEGSESGRSRFQVPSQKFFEFSEESRFQMPSKKIQRKEIVLPELDLEEEETDRTQTFADLRKAVAKIAKLKSKDKVYSNAVAIAQTVEKLCEEDELDCGEVLDEFAGVIKSPSKVKAKTVKKALDALIKEVHDLWKESAEEFDLDLEE